MELHLVLTTTLLVVVLWIIWKVLDGIVLKPYFLTKKFAKHGIRCPPYELIFGNLHGSNALKEAAMETVLHVKCHDIVPRVFPDIHHWSNLYGKTFFFWNGVRARVCIREPELVKEVLSKKMDIYPKPRIGPNLRAMIGRGLVFVEGSDWTRHRRIVTPAFQMDKLKMMTGVIAECTLEMLEDWQARRRSSDVDGEEEIVVEVSAQFQELTANVISHTAFGSSYKEGKEVFVAQKELGFIVADSFRELDIPGFQYLPTKRNIKKWKLERTMRDKLMGIIKSRLREASTEDSKSYGDDLLGLMLEAWMNTSEHESKITMDEIVDECKTFFFAGQDTTSHLLTWTLFLLSTNPEWQDLLRREVLDVCGGAQIVPDSDMLSKLKLVNMVLLEALRLYSPVVMMSRKATRDMSLGPLKVPRDTDLVFPILMIHRDKEYWGENANDFDPRRFEQGVVRAAKHPNALMAFSMGPRSCVGQTFAMMEAKLVVAMIVQRFSFSISSEYKHAPVVNVTLQPQFGLPIVFTPQSPANTSS